MSWRWCPVWRRCHAHAALIPCGDADLSVFARCSFFQRNFHRVRQVAAAVDLRSSARAPAPTLAENITKYVAKGIRKAAESFRATTSATHIRVHASMAMLVIGCTFFGIREHLVSLFGLLETLLSILGFVTLIAVRVMLHGRLAVGLFDFFFGHTFGESENFVVIAFCHDLDALCERVDARV